MKQWFVLVFWLGLVLPVLAQDALTWAAVSEKVSKHETVRLASATLAIAQAELEAETSWKGLKISARPVTQATATDLGLDLLFPLGITDAEREKKLLLTEALELRLREVQEATGSATLDLYRSYTAAYLAQEAVTVAEVDRDWEAARLQAVRQRVQQGSLTTSAGSLAEADFQDAEATLSQARLDQRLAWFTLAFKANWELPAPDHAPGSRDPLGLVPRLQKPTQGTLPSPELPPVLIASAQLKSSSTLAQKQRIARAERALAASSSLSLSFAPQISYARPEGLVSLGFSSATGAISLGGDWPVYQAPVPTTKAVEPTLTGSLLVTFDLAGDTSSRRRALEGAVEWETRRLEYIEATLELTVRSRYAAYLKARDSGAENQRSLESAQSSVAAFATKKQIGQVSPEDEAANTAFLARTTFNHDKAQASLALAYFELMEAASAWEKI